MMDRRVFIGTFMGGLLVAPTAAKAQQAGKVYRVGLLSASVQAVEGLREGLQDLGYRDGESFVIEQRNVEGRFERLQAAVVSLLRVPVDVIVAGGSESVQAARNATRTIPVVFTNVGDPVEQGFIASYAKPGGNITSVTNMVTELTGKWLELLKEVRPATMRVAVLWNPPQPAHHGLLSALESSAARLRLEPYPVPVRTTEDLDAAFASIRRERVGGLTMLGSLVHFRSLRRIAAFTQEARLPAVAWTNEFTRQGGLMSYGVAEGDQYRRAATYVDRILKGAQPGDIPVEQPTRFLLIINLRTAKALGLTIPPSVLARADEVIE
jgi:putative tryptophan/tyrosine transport system substrate-binding protein